MDPTTRVLMMGSSAGGDKYWIARLGSTLSDAAQNVPGVDSSGNIYIAGYAGSDIFTAKLDPSGAVTWQRTLNGGSDDLAHGCCLDSSFNAYVVGYTYVGSTPKAFISKYNSSGVIQWQNRLGSSTNGDYYYGVASDLSDNIYALGQFYTPRSSYYDLVITKFNSSGSVLWSLSLYPINNNSYGSNIATDSSGNVYPVGTSYSSTFGTNVCYLAKVNTSGAVQWERQFFVTTSGSAGSGIATDTSGNVYACGYSISGSYYITIIVKYDSSGTVLWQQQLSSALGNVISGNVAVDSSGNVYVCGYAPTASTGQSLYIVKYNSSGALQWQRIFDGTSGTGAEVGLGISINKNSVIVTGYSGTSSVGNADALVLKVPTDGSLTGTYGPYTYSAGSLTAAAGTALTLSASYTTASPSLTPVTTSLTDSAGTLTPSVINIS